MFRLAMAIGLCIPAAWQVDGSFGLAVGELCDALEDMEAASGSLSVAVTYTRGETGRKGGHVLGFESLYLEDSSGRVRVDRSETRELEFSDDRKERGVISMVAAFDGTTVRRMEGRDADFVLGRISETKGDLPWAGSPREYSTHYFGVPVSRLLRDFSAEVVGRSEQSVIVDTRENYVDRDHTDRKYRFRIHDDFSISERSAMIRFSGSEVWHTYTRIRSSDFVDTEVGMRVPTLAVVEHYDTTKVSRGEAVQPLLTSSEEFRLANWDFSPVFDDSTFEIDFPAGVSVTDTIQGKTYKTAANLTDSAVSQHVREASDVAGAHNSAVSRYRWLIVSNLVVLLVVGIFCLVRWSRRSH